MYVYWKPNKCLPSSLHSSYDPLSFKMFEIILFCLFSWSLFFYYTLSWRLYKTVWCIYWNTLNSDTKQKKRNIERTCGPIEILRDFTLSSSFPFPESTQGNIFVNISRVVWHYVKHRLCWNYWCWTLCLRGKSRGVLCLFGVFRYQAIPAPKDNEKICVLQLSVYQLFASSKLRGWMSC